MLRRTLNLGILAHVDAGKTTLTERLLYAAGVIDELGSVDDGSTQTDSLPLERRRGITIKSAVVSFEIGDVAVNLIDTPGHPDFIAEVERVLSVLDGAVLVVSAVEGVQSQTPLLMRALQRLRVPTLIFVNKIDRRGADSERVLQALSERLTSAIVPLGSVRDPGSRAACFTPWDGADPAFDVRLATVLAERDEAILAVYVEDETAPFASSAAGSACRADEAGAGASGVVRLCDHGSGHRLADLRNRGATPCGPRRRRRAGFGHRLQGRTRSRRGEDRLRPHVLGHGGHARPGAARRRR